MNDLSRRNLILLTGLLLAVPSSARAQFEEPDTVPSFGIGPLVELTFRGGRGETDAPGSLDYTTGVAVGARVEYRFNPTRALAVQGTLGRSQERLISDRGDNRITGADLTLVQVTGDVLFRIKQSAPGYFAIGGGIRLVRPDTDDANLATPDSFTEGLVTLAAGVEFAATRESAFRVEARGYGAVPAEQPFDTKAFIIDFSLGVNYQRRF